MHIEVRIDVVAIDVVDYPEKMFSHWIEIKWTVKLRFIYDFNFPLISFFDLL